jgi:hypothetical protein
MSNFIFLIDLVQGSSPGIHYSLMFINWLLDRIHTHVIRAIYDIYNAFVRISEIILSARWPEMKHSVELIRLRL